MIDCGHPCNKCMDVYLSIYLFSMWTQWWAWSTYPGHDVRQPDCPDPVKPEPQKCPNNQV